MEDINLTIAKITHEIRNPLTLINSSLQLIESVHPEVKDFQFWSQTLEDVEYLNQLLDDLAAYSDSRRFFMGRGRKRYSPELLWKIENRHWKILQGRRIL